MLALDIGLRWLHVLSAIALMGGALFMRFALWPSFQELAEEQRRDLEAAVRGRWARLVMITSGFLLLSGLINMIRNMSRYDFPGEISTPMYHGMLGLKFLLALPIFYIAARLSGRSEGAAEFRKQAKFWMNVSLLLAVVVVCLGGVLRFADRVPKKDDGSVGAPTALLTHDR